MKLANIYLSIGNAVKGQAATGTTDNNAIDVVVCDGTGTSRDIRQIVVTDSLGNPTVITRRLQSSGTNYLYVSGPLTTVGNAFNNYCTGSNQWKISFEFRITSAAAKTQLVYNYSTPGYTGYEVYVSNGKITYTTMYEGRANTVSWSNWTLSTNVWYTLTIYGNGKTSGGNVTLNNYGTLTGVSVVSASDRSRTLTIGAANVQFRGQVYLEGTSYSNTSVSNVFTADIDSATAGDDLVLTNNGFTLSGTTVQVQINTSWVQ